MDIPVGKRVALALTSEWCQSMAKHRFLKTEAFLDTGHPTDLLVGEIQSLESVHGIWVKPDETFSDFPKGTFFIPWSVIVGAALLGPDDEKKVVGFAK